MVYDIKVENQFFKVKVKGLKEELAEFKAKLENVSNAKPIVDPDTIILYSPSLLSSI